MFKLPYSRDEALNTFITLMTSLRISMFFLNSIHPSLNFIYCASYSLLKGLYNNNTLSSALEECQDVVRNEKMEDCNIRTKRNSILKVLIYARHLVLHSKNKFRMLSLN